MILIFKNSPSPNSQWPKVHNNVTNSNGSQQIGPKQISCLEVGLTKMAPGIGKQRPWLAHSISTTGAGIT